MATMQALLEKDKERFLQNMKAAKSPGESVRALEEQLSRILTEYNEDEESIEVKTNAKMLVETLISSAGLLDCDGESIIWSKSQYRKGVSKPKRSIWFVLFIILGLLLLIASFGFLIYFTDTLPPSNNMLIGLGLALLGALFMLFAGISSAKKNKENREDLYAETIPDPSKTYHILLNSVLTMDRILTQIKNKEVLDQKKALLEEKEEFNKEDLSLLTGLLESAYAEPDNEYAKEVISEISYYLHRKKIEIVDYNGENKEFFDRMPSQNSSTIRPALIMADTVLVKGLAAGE